MKRKRTIKQLKKRLKIVKTLLLISYACFFIMFFLFSFAVLTNYKMIDILKKEGIILQVYDITKNVTNITINFTDLSKDEKKIAQNLVSSMKDIYLLPQKSITFSRNISSFYGEGYNETTTGFYINGNVYVKWRNNTKSNAITLCHESLHNFFKTNEQAHKIIYDVADYLTCFKETET